MKVVCSMQSLQPPTPLPITAKDRDPNAERAFAAQYFNIPATSTNIPTWIAGTVVFNAPSSLVGCFLQFNVNVNLLFFIGYIELPPRGLKDAEAVGDCAQVFFVGDCHDGAGTVTFFPVSIFYCHITPMCAIVVEMGIAEPSQEEWIDDSAQRSLLKKGDSFFVPPGNIYRFINLF